MDDKTGVKLWAVLMTGLPYAVFKLGAGWYLQSAGHRVFGWPLVVWGVFDIFDNLAALVRLHPRAYCLLAAIGHWLDRGRQPPRYQNLFLGIDTLATLLIVSAMIWFGAIPKLPAGLLLVWNVAVVANITGVGLQRVWLGAKQFV